MPQKLSVALLLSASLVALTCAHAQAQSGFLIEPPGARDDRRAAAPRSMPAPASAPAVAPAPQGDLFASKPPVTPVEGGKDGPDETALRYYAAQNQAIRVTTEAARLQRLHPTWTPPANLYDRVDTSGEDEQAMWDLFGADRLDELRTAIAMRQRAEPGWKPSAELVDKMARKATRLRLIALWNDGRLGDIIESVRAEGYGGADADVDLRWTVAEVYARMKQTSEAIAVYQSILGSSTDRNERLATIQKAMDNLRISDVEPLIAQGRVEAGGLSEFSPLAIDITRARISAYLHDERAEPVPAHEFKAFEEYARGVKDANQAGLVAWHHYKVKAFQEALDWFKLALERGGDAMIAHGLAHSLRELGLAREAEEVAYAWREPLINNAILFIDMLERELTRQTPAYIEPERLLRYAQVTMDLASGEGAQALGWYAYNTCQFEPAHEWFQRAVAWFPKETTVVGLALSARRLKKTKDFFEIANRYDGLFPKLIELLFPDNIARPPTACDIMATNGSRKPLAAAAPAPAQPWKPPVVAGATSARHPGWSNVMARPPAAPATSAGWSQPAWAPATQLVNERMPKFAKGEFPVAVDPENPLRFASTGKLFSAPSQTTTPPAGQTPLVAEPWRQAPPLVARRTPGVGSMPYERWGFSLLPGGNGLQSADAPHSAQSAPAGTMWAAEQTTGTLVNRQGPEGADPFVQMQAIAGAARVPSPSVVRPAVTGPVYLRSSAAPIADPVAFAELRPAFAGSDLEAVDHGAVSSIVRTEPMAQSVAHAETGDAEEADETAAAFPVSDDLGRKAVGLYESKQYVAAIEALDLRASIAPETSDLQLVRGWSLLNLARTEEARQVFAQMGDAPQGRTPDPTDRRR